MEKETYEQRPDGSEGRSSVTIWERALQREGAVSARNRARSVPNLLEEGQGQCGSIRESLREERLERKSGQKEGEGVAGSGHAGPKLSR